MNSIVLSGACIKLYINNKLYKEVQEVRYDKDYGEEEIRGIDTPHPQEIAPGKASVSGQVSGIRIKYSGGLQAYNMRPLMKDILSSPYVSIRIQDRATKEDILFIPNAKITRESFQGTIKGTVKISFAFKGLVAFDPLDRA